MAFSVLLTPFAVYPFIGALASAWFKAIGTSKYLHRRVSDEFFWISTLHLLQLVIAVLRSQEDEK